MSEHPWMRHDVTGHTAQLPDLPYWRAQGWEPCDAPPEVENLRDPLPEVPADQPESAGSDKPSKPAVKPAPSKEK